MIWGALRSVDKRVLNPYSISEEDALVLHDVFTFWKKRNFREYVRDKYRNPLCLSIDERWVYYFVWKSVGISHTIPDFPKVLNKGLNGIMEEIDARLKDEKNTEQNPLRKKELEKLAGICAKVPAGPSEKLDEAVNTIWIVWVVLHIENTNTGLSIGRLDQWLQPYFAKDMENIRDRAATGCVVLYPPLRGIVQLTNSDTPIVTLRLFAFGIGVSTIKGNSLDDGSGININSKKIIRCAFFNPY